MGRVLGIAENVKNISKRVSHHVEHVPLDVESLVFGIVPLLGDVNGNRVVAVSDVGLVNAQLAQPVTAANYLKDVNATGTLTVADKGITNANLAKALPAP
jgi:hypothetical protein